MNFCQSVSDWLVFCVHCEHQDLYRKCQDKTTSAGTRSGVAVSMDTHVHYSSTAYTGEKI